MYYRELLLNLRQTVDLLQKCTANTCRECVSVRCYNSLPFLDDFIHKLTLTLHIGIMFKFQRLLATLTHIHTTQCWIDLITPHVHSYNQPSQSTILSRVLQFGICILVANKQVKIINLHIYFSTVVYNTLLLLVMH